MKNIMSEVEEGEGLLHGLIYEPKPGDAIDSLTGALTDLRALIGDAKDGKGEIGETLRALSESIANFEEITTRIRSGPGMLHEAVYAKGDKGLMANLNSAAENLNEILVKINEGEGTFGAFLNDPTLYEDLKIITGGAKRSGRVKRVVEYTIKKYDRKKEERPAATP
jgi:phospholipid/cholesterol/gamma-HCH transport system substrate-binding protein